VSHLSHHVSLFLRILDKGGELKVLEDMLDKNSEIQVGKESYENEIVSLLVRLTVYKQLVDECQQFWSLIHGQRSNGHNYVGLSV